MKSSPDPGAVVPPLPLSAESAGGVAISHAASDPRALAHDKAIDAAVMAIEHAIFNLLSDDAATARTMDLTRGEQKTLALAAICAYEATK